MMKKYVIVLTIIAILGLAVSITMGTVYYNAYHNPSLNSFCNINELFSCSSAVLSKYSSHLGIPNFIVGIVYYVMLSCLALYALVIREKLFKKVLQFAFWMSLFGSFFSIYLFFASWLDLNSFCILCIAIYLFNFIGLYIAFKGLKTRVNVLINDLHEDIMIFFSSKRKTMILLTILVVFIAICAIVPKLQLVSKANEGKADDLHVQFDQSNGQRLFAGTKEIPAITVVVYSDYECSHCAKAHEEVKKLIEKNKDVRVVYKDFPLDQACNQKITRQFHLNACRAALFARCAADEGKFEEYHDLLYKNQGLLDEKSLFQYAESIHIKGDNFQHCVKQQKYLDDIVSDVDDGYALFITGTPTFMIEGKVLVGYRTYEQLQEVVDSVRKERLMPQ